MIAGSTYDLFCILLQFGRRVRPGRNDEQNWLVGIGFTLVEAWEGKGCRLDNLIPESLLHELIHARFEAIRAKHLNQNAPLEGCDTIRDLVGKFELGLLRVRKLRPHLLIVKLKIGNQICERVYKHSKDVFSVFWDPLRQSNVRFGGGCRLAIKEFPLVKSEKFWINSLHKVKCIRQSVSFEKWSTDFAKAEFNERVWQLFKFFFSWVCLGSRLKSSIKKSDKAGQRELVHIVHLDQISEHHEQIGANYGEIAIHLSLLIKTDLQFFRFLQGDLNLTTLNLGLIQRLDQIFVFEDVASRVCKSH